MWTPFCAGSRSTEQSISADDELLAPPAAHADRLLTPGDARARQAEPHLGRGGLEVGRGQLRASPSCRQTYQAATWPTTQTSPSLVSLACHDLRTPLATVYGFARTLTRASGLDPTADRYVEMIDAASRQMAELLDELCARRADRGRALRPELETRGPLTLAAAAAERLGDDRVDVSGHGRDGAVDAETGEAVGVGARPVRARHGGLDASTSSLDGAGARGLADHGGVGAGRLGEDLRDLGAAVAVRLSSSARRLGRRRRRHAARSASGLDPRGRPARRAPRARSQAGEPRAAAVPRRARVHPGGDESHPELSRR